MIQVTRYHDFSYGHMVLNHEGKCRHLHGHNGRVHFTVQANQGLDDVGRVLDFSVINTRLCRWVEDNWDHRFLIAEHHPKLELLLAVDPDGLVVLDYNPTAELMCTDLLRRGPDLLRGTGTRLIGVRLEETRKCSAEVWLP